MLIHVGFPKTGSTWLQEDMFAGDCAGFWSPWRLEPKAEFLQSNPFGFSAARARAVFQPGIDEALQRGLVPVITDEWLTGNQVTADYRGKQIADQLHATFPKARVLIVIREQRSMLVSSYREFVACDGVLTFEEFLGRGALGPGFDPHCRLDHLEYDLPISCYRTLFGADRVMVEPFERMIADPMDFHRRLSAFSGANGRYVAPKPATNVGLRGATLASRRQFNNLVQPFAFQFERGRWRRNCIRRLTELIGRGVPNSLNKRLESVLQARVRAQVGGVYAESNRRTSQLIGFELGSLGYTV